jgi:hypothetical protein
MFPYLKKYLFLIGSFTTCLILISIVIISFLRERNFNKIYEDVIIPYNSLYAENWLKAIETDNPKEAIKIAEQIIPKQLPYIPSIRYLNITQSAQINSNFFNPPFAIIDFEYWRDMYKIHKIANSFKGNPEKPIIPENIFNIINKKIKTVNYKNEKYRPSFFYEIWNNKKGDIIDKYLLFSVLTQQAGYNTQIALVYGTLKKEPMHIVAEAIKDGHYYTCDFFTKTSWNKSLSKVLKENSSQLKKLWKKKWVDGPKLIMYKAEFPASSYKKANQYLGTYLSNYKSNRMPLIGNDATKYQNAFKKQIFDKENSAFSLGIEPFLMLKNSNLFLKTWRMKKVKK